MRPTVRVTRISQSVGHTLPRRTPPMSTGENLLQRPLKSLESRRSCSTGSPGSTTTSSSTRRCAALAHRVLRARRPPATGARSRHRLARRGARRRAATRAAPHGAALARGHATRRMPTPLPPRAQLETARRDPHARRARRRRGPPAARQPRRQRSGNATVPEPTRWRGREESRRRRRRESARAATCRRRRAHPDDEPHRPRSAAGKASAHVACFIGGWAAADAAASGVQ